VCTDLLPKVPSMVCTCAQSYMEDNWDTLSKTMLECVNKKVGMDKPLTLPPTLTQGPFKQMALQLMQQVIDNKINNMFNRYSNALILQMAAMHSTHVKMDLTSFNQ
jgi:hypothetical protein